MSVPALDACHNYMWLCVCHSNDMVKVLWLLCVCQHSWITRSSVYLVRYCTINDQHSCLLRMWNPIFLASLFFLVIMLSVLKICDTVKCLWFGLYAWECQHNLRLRTTNLLHINWGHAACWHWTVLPLACVQITTTDTHVYRFTASHRRSSNWITNLGQSSRIAQICSRNANVIISFPCVGF